MLKTEEIRKIVEGINKEELGQEIIETALCWRRRNTDNATIYAELNLETGEVDVNVRADFEHIPEKEKGLWIAQFSTYNMEEIPCDLPDDIKGKDNEEELYYARYGADCVDFIDEIDLEEMITELV